MRAPAAPADAAGALEAHMSAQLRPVDGIKPAHLSFDRHSTPAYSGGLLPGRPKRLGHTEKAKIATVWITKSLIFNDSESAARNSSVFPLPADKPRLLSTSCALPRSPERHKLRMRFVP